MENLRIMKFYIHVLYKDNLNLIACIRLTCIHSFVAYDFLKCANLNVKLCKKNTFEKKNQRRNIRLKATVGSLGKPSGGTRIRLE